MTFQEDVIDHAGAPDYLREIGASAGKLAQVIDIGRTVQRSSPRCGEVNDSLSAVSHEFVRPKEGFQSLYDVRVPIGIPPCPDPGGPGCTCDSFKHVKG
jgi:hypothetical protein